MTNPTPVDPAPVEASASRRRRLGLGAQAILGAACVLALLAAVAFVLSSGRPSKADFRVGEQGPEARAALAREARLDRQALLRDPAYRNDITTYWRADALLVGAAVNEFHLREGRLPWSLSEAGVAEEAVAEGMFLQSSRREWRLVSPGGRTIARGD